MKFMLTLLVLGYIALATAAPSLPVHPGGVGGLYIGPNSETIIKGPDGSVITSAAIGGQVHTNLQPIIVAEPTIVEEVVSGVVPIEAVIVPAPVVEAQQSSDLIGPSGRISTQGSQSVVAGPASTTITGPAVVGETLVRGLPIIGNPVLSAVAPVTALPISITGSPLGELAPISVTAAPPVTFTQAELAEAGIDISQLVGAPLGISVATVTPVTPQTVVTASVSPHQSIATASSSSPGTVAKASVAPNIATASVETTGNIGISTVTASPLPQISPVTNDGLIGLINRNVGTSALIGSTLPPISSTFSPFINNGIQGVGRQGLVNPNVGISTVTGLPLPTIPSTISPVINDGIQRLDGHDFVGINSPAINDGIQRLNDHDLAGINNQLALDNRRLNVNPSLIPTANLIPPEITIGLRGVIDGRLVGRLPSGELLTTPGLGSVAPSSNIQRQEADGTVRVTPSALQLETRNGLTQGQLAALQNQQNLLNNQISDPRLVNSNQQVINVTPRNEILLNPNVDPRLLGKQTLASIQQQQILSAELAKSGIDASQLQLTNVPLSAVSAVPIDLTNLNRGIVNNAGAWAPYDRQTRTKNS